MVSGHWPPQRGDATSISTGSRPTAGGSTSSTASCCRPRSTSAPRASARGSSRTGRSVAGGETARAGRDRAQPVRPARARRSSGSSSRRAGPSRSRRRSSWRRSARASSASRSLDGSRRSRRARVAADLTVGGTPFGQQARGAGGRRVSDVVGPRLRARAARRTFARLRRSVGARCAAATRGIRHGRGTRRDTRRCCRRASTATGSSRAALDDRGSGRDTIDCTDTRSSCGSGARPRRAHGRAACSRFAR